MEKAMETAIDLMHHLEKLASGIYFPLYWTNLESKILGANQAYLDTIGVKQSAEIIGKSLHEYLPENSAQQIADHVDLVIQTGRVHTSEDIIQDCSTGQIRHFTSSRSPLMGTHGEVIGIIGTVLETALEKNVQSKIESGNKSLGLSEKESFAQTVQKVAHDIQSPLTAMSIVLSQCDELAESKRVILKNAFAAFKDITNNILNRYVAGEIKTAREEERQLVLCSDFLLKLISEKKYQYQDLSIKFKTEIAPNAHFSFIHVQPSQFRRAVSNFISNAVDASKHRANACITIKLAIDPGLVKVTIQDNGKGMTRSMVEKIFQRTSFTEGKENGHGLGMMQIWDMVDGNQAALDISSQAGVGTVSTLTFPKAPKAAWVMDEININHNDIIVILDDDQLIHDAWDLRLNPLAKLNSKLIVRHEKQGQAVLDYVNSLGPQDKKRLYFLCDFELIGQSMNGLQVIEASEIERAVLVTNYHLQPAIQESALKLGIKILPKQMTSVAPFYCTQKHCFLKLNVDQIRCGRDLFNVEQLQEEYCV